MLEDLKTTREVRLMSVRSKPPGVMEEIHAFADASFVPTGAASHGGSVMFVGA